MCVIDLYLEIYRGNISSMLHHLSDGWAGSSRKASLLVWGLWALGLWVLVLERDAGKVFRFFFTLSRSSENFSGYLYIFHGVYRNNCHSKGWIIVMCKNFPEVLRLSGRAKTFRLAIPGFLSLCYFLLGKTSFPQLRTCFTATPDTKRICFFEVELLWHISLCGHLRLYSPTLNFLQF